MTQAPTEAKALPMGGQVAAITAKGTGLRLEGMDYWLNYSHTRQGPWHDHKKGDMVKLMVKDGKWIESVEVVNELQSEMASENGRWSSKEHDEIILIEVLVKAAVDLHGLTGPGPGYQNAVTEIADAVNHWRQLA